MGVLHSYIAGSLAPESAERVDPLGLPYPGISLNLPNGFAVQSVVVRSVFQYMWINTHNVIEIALYREWNGWNTNPEPVMQASVSMFNADWDTEMESIENTTLERKWDQQLHNFFGQYGVSHKNTGLLGLVTEIREVQGFLSDAAATIPPHSVKASIPDATPTQEELLG